jgi:broad specificity phosphatase PhoE
VRRRDRWPTSLLLVRHGESSGNVARDAAEAAGAPWIDIALRDTDVPLSDRGAEQAVAVGKWLNNLGREKPTVALSSPYVRAESTARLALDAAGLARVPLAVDERLREREFGMLDRLTRVGIEQRFPDQAEARSRLGKFYHRPPGGESWADVALRVRSLIDSVSREHAGERVLIVAHQVVILMMRYVLEHLTEAEILAIDKQGDLTNCSVTAFRFDPRLAAGGGMRLELFNHPVALEEAGAPVTEESDAPLGPR